MAAVPPFRFGSGGSPRAGSVIFAAVLALALVLGGEDPLSGASKKKSSEDVWPEITAAEKQLKSLPQDPQAGAVVLSRERDGKILRRADDWVNILNYHERYKVLSDAGKWVGEVRIPAYKFSRVSNIMARTIKPDGTILPVADDQIFEKTVVKARGFRSTEWVFNFPAVEPGAILEFRYDRHDSRLFFIDPYYFEGPAHTLRSRVTQVFPATMGYSILCDRCPAEIQPTVSKWREGKAKGTLYSMELTDLQGYRPGIMMPPPRAISPRMEMVLHTWKGHYLSALGRTDGFFTDWESVAKVASYYYDEAIKSGRSKLRPVVEGWIAGLADPEEKIKAIVRHVREDFRYRYYQTVYGYSFPVERILKEKTADNEEKAVLLLAALQAIGVDADIALVVGKHVGSLNPHFTSLSQFSHAIVGLRDPGGAYRWIDPTVTCASHDFLPWQDSGAQALVLKAGAGELIDLPVKVEPSLARYQVLVKPDLTGRAALEIEAEFRGEDALDYRDTLLPATDDDREAFLQEWLDDHRRGAVLKEYTIEKLNEFEEPLIIKMKAEAPGLVTAADGVMAVRACVLTCMDSNPIPGGKRTHPLFVDRGWNEAETVIFEPPAGMTPAPGPAPVAARSSVALMTFRCDPEGDAGLRCARQFIARRNRWPASELTRVREMFDRIVQADQTRVAFKTQ